VVRNPAIYPISSFDGNQQEDAMPKQILKKTSPVLLTWDQAQAQTQVPVFQLLAAEVFQVGAAQTFNISYLMMPKLVLPAGNAQHSEFQVSLKMSLYWSMSTIGSTPPVSTSALYEVVSTFADPVTYNQQTDEKWRGTVPISVAFPVKSLSLEPGSYLVAVCGSIHFQNYNWSGENWHIDAPCGYLTIGVAE
jgi:hypothetical protein